MKPTLRIRYLSAVLLLSPSIYFSAINTGAAVPSDQGQGILVAQLARRFLFRPSGIGIPNRRVPGASRGETCLLGRKQLTALVPEKTVLTTSGYPTLFFYVPQNNAQAFEFIVQNLPRQDTQNSSQGISDSSEPLYKATLKPTNQSGIVSVTLPTNSNSSSLAIGKRYQWTFSVVCDQQNRDADKVVDGTLQRITVSPTLNSQLQQVNDRERAALYAQNGIWANSLTTLANLRNTHPTDSGLKADWEDLLRSVGLPEMVQEPLLPCCKVQNWQ